LTEQHAYCEKLFSDTITRKSDGKFIVKYPFKQEPPLLGNSYQSAKKRFLSIEHKLQKDSNLSLQYKIFMSEYLQLGHMEPCQNSQPNYYLPHHAIFKDQKIRVVFDGSAKTSNGKSLNDTLSNGPVVQNNLFNILINFRKYQYAFTADIEKMFRQIEVHEQDKKYQRILWRENPNEELKHFQLNTITYGLKSSSYLATRCILQISKDYSHDSTVSSIIKNSFYVDDCMSGCKTELECINIKNKLISIFQSYGMNLVKWTSNSVPICDTNHKNLQSSQDVQQKVLGLYWNNLLDTFNYKPTFNNIVYTKRNIMSEISKLYDPLGLLSPIVINFKILMQEVWKLKIGWDDPLPHDITQKWNSLYKDIHENIQLLQIPRLIVPHNATDIKLVAFSDASPKAYGTSIYLRAQDNNGKISSTLICSKSKVAPLKLLTIPRLELCAALLMTSLVKEIIDTLSLNVSELFLYSDSMVVLHWISGETQKLDTFIANRIAKIQDNIKNPNWYYVPSKQNPADLISRGSSVNDLISSTLWWQGPSWICQPVKDWPKLSAKDNTQHQKQIISNVTTLNSQNIITIENYSSFDKLLRITAYVLRFIHNIKGKERYTGSLSISEIKNAHNYLVKCVQAETFIQEIKDIKSKNSVSSKSHIISLNPIICDDILCVGGRLENSNVDEQQKHPILLPSKHHFTKLIIQKTHTDNLHTGPTTTLAHVRLKYWPIAGITTVKRILKTCIVCFRYNAKESTQLMAPLPEQRVNIPLRPFYNISVDYTGFFQLMSGLHRNSKTVKAYYMFIHLFEHKSNTLRASNFYEC
jgi:hypothetical protein